MAHSGLAYLKLAVADALLVGQFLNTRLLCEEGLLYPLSQCQVAALISGWPLNPFLRLMLLHNSPALYPLPLRPFPNKKLTVTFCQIDCIFGRGHICMYK